MPSLQARAGDDANTTAPLPPLPSALIPSGTFDGNDGKWSTFFINVGDAEGTGAGQNFKVLISTSSPLTLVPFTTEWCDEECAANRGVQVFNGEQSSGFDTQASASWMDAGTYDVPLPHWWEGNLNSSLGAFWGSENVGLGQTSTDSDILAQQLVATYTFDTFYMGSFGLAAGSVKVGSDEKQPFLANFVDFDQIASVSYGYTAGASYRNDNKGIVGSLVLGGYDKARFQSEKGHSITMPNAQNTTLVVGVQSILYKPRPEVEANVFSLTSDATRSFYATIDSTLPYLWLPEDVCDQFAERFQLEYDQTLNLYTVNDTSHRANQQQNATVSFKIGSNPQDSFENTSIELPYAAFDLQADNLIFPNASGSTNYFPIRQSKNGMFVLGRVFLQESYIIVDYERTNFTVAPVTVFDALPQQQLTPIFNTSYSPPRSTDNSASDNESGLSPGAVAGIVVGIVVAFLVVGLGAFFWWKKRRQRKQMHSEKQENQSDIDTVVAGSEIKHRRVSELDSEPPNSPKPSPGGYYARDAKTNIPFPPINEMESPPVELYSPPPESAQFSSPGDDGANQDYFIAGTKVRRRGATRESSGNNTPGTPAAIAELPGDDGKFQVGGVHFEPVASPTQSPVHSRGASDSSLGIDQVIASSRDVSRERSAVGARDAMENVEEHPSEDAKDSSKSSAAKEAAEGNLEENQEEKASAPQQRPSQHTREMSDVTVASDSTVVSQPTPEELESWAAGSNDEPRRPLSE